MMKVEMQIVDKKDRSTRALKPFLVDERWAERIEKQTKGKIRRVLEEKQPPARKVSRRRKQVVEE